MAGRRFVFSAARVVSKRRTTGTSSVARYVTETRVTHIRRCTMAVCKISVEFTQQGVDDEQDRELERLVLGCLAVGWSCHAVEWGVGGAVSGQLARWRLDHWPAAWPPTVIHPSS